MKNQYLAVFIFSLLMSCSTRDTKEQVEKELSDIEKIAEAYGIGNFSKINTLHYTFNVDRDTVNLVSRSWVWNKSVGDITLVTVDDTVHFRQDALTEELKKTDHHFINDKYWLLFPLQLVWDREITATNMGKKASPISGDVYTMLTIQYGEGGYTPGDAYDLYLDENWLIREWAFRKSGKEEPGSGMVWEDYKDFNGIKVATNHHNGEGGIRLYFTGIKFE